MSVKFKLITMFILVALITIAPTSYLSFKNLEQQATQRVESKMLGTANTVTSDLNGWIQGNIKVVKTLGTLLQDAVSEDQLTPAYLQAHKNDDIARSVTSIYVGYEDGKFIDSGNAPQNFDPRKRPWYKQAKETGKLVVTDPYLDMGTKSYTISISYPFKNQNGQLQGVIGLDILLSDITSIVSKVNLDGMGFAFLVDKNGTVLAHPDKKLLNTNLKNNADLKSVVGDMISKPSGQAEYTHTNETQILVYKKIPSSGWVVAASISKDLAYEQLTRIRTQFIWINVAALVVVIALAFFLSMQIIKPLARLKATSQKMSEGDLTVKVSVNGKDEIAELGHSFNTMAENLRHLIQKVADSATTIDTTSKNMHHHASDSGKIAEQISTAVEELAKGATDQAESVFTGAEMVTEMTQSVQRISQNVERSVQMIDQVNQAVSDGFKTIVNQVQLSGESKLTTKDVGESIQLLADKSHRIEEIVGVIHNLATQTNLLALNAAIEAARAGEHGRGFAVVAGEVRKLAEQSAASSDNIIVLIKEIQQATLQSVDKMAKAKQVVEYQESAVSDTKASFDKIKESVENIVVQIHEVSAAEAALSANATNISDVISTVAAVAEQSAASTEEVASSTHEQSGAIIQISELSGELTKNADSLLEEVGRFKI
ncbi:methyl-accepting chemotaxis protein [Paenibacillus tuaregi]|uniref:methyl-accepting chemotaxis protein n=1 Tax=Paenibacillus tuaregi TaxID=1816681 RepID=UPI000837AB92|nr:methyl-accepting chemotaxis protein [Paenibacillus tuaregi]